MEEILSQIQLLYEYFNNWSLLIVLVTFLLMIPLNIAFKKVFKNENLQRARKIISSVSVYAIAMIFVAIFTMFIAKKDISVVYVISASIPVGFIAQVSWELVKVGKDYGVKPIMAKIVKSKEFENSLAKLGVDKRLIGILKEQVKDYDATTLTEFVEKEVEISTKIRTELLGFVEGGKIQEAVCFCIEEIKKNLKPEKKEQKISVAKEV